MRRFKPDQIASLIHRLQKEIHEELLAAERHEEDANKLQQELKQLESIRDRVEDFNELHAEANRLLDRTDLSWASMEILFRITDDQYIYEKPADYLDDVAAVKSLLLTL